MPVDQKPSRGLTLRNRVRYRFDNLLSRGTGAALLFLAGITLAGVLIASALLAMFPATFDGSEDTSWLEESWQSLLRVMDPGTMAGDVGWGTRLLALLVTVFGILVAGTLIGIVATGIEQRVTELRRGRSTVVESGHMVILGASGRLPVVIEQLALANRRRRRNVIVVLANREPDELRDDVRGYADSLHSSRLVFRWGDPTRTSDLAITSIRDARAVIVLADGEADADAGAVKAVLAAGAALGGFDRIPIIVDIDDPETAESLARACGGAVQPLVAKQSIARIMAFALREPGLSQVVSELLGFRGCDIYVRDAGGVTGLPFGETVFRFANARPIGRMLPDGAVEINPDPGTKIDRHDRLIVIAEDDHVPKLATTGPPEVGQQTATLPPEVDVGPGQEHVLIIGWNALGGQLLTALRQHAAPGSSAEVIYDARLFEPDELPDTHGSGLKLTLTPKRSASWQPGDLGVIADTTSIVLLGYRRGMTTEEADSQTLLNLLLLRRDLEGRDDAEPRVVVELLDADNVDLARVTGADDYVVSDAVTSRLMAQYAEQPERRPVLQNLYGGDGPSLRLVAAEDFGLSGQVRFDEIIATVYSYGLLALGWRSADERGGKLVLNPDNDEQARLGADDQVVVIG
jgi:Trk K+ transport system NAD-binding subunit